MTAVTVAARVETYSLSAHADRNGLLDIIGELSPAQTMLVHGARARPEGIPRDPRTGPQPPHRAQRHSVESPAVTPRRIQPGRPGRSA